MSGMTDALIVNAAVLTVVLEADLGSHRKIGWLRVARPLVTAAMIVPFFLAGVATGGAGLMLEVAATLGGVLLGLGAGALSTVYRSPRTGKPVSRTGLGYVGLWVAVSAARLAFSYGSQHWFGAALGSWMDAHSVTTGAITDALIFMALAMVITRTASLGVRAANLPRTASAGDFALLPARA